MMKRFFKDLHLCDERWWKMRHVQSNGRSCGLWDYKHKPSKKRERKNKHEEEISVVQSTISEMGH